MKKSMTQNRTPPSTLREPKKSPSTLIDLEDLLLFAQNPLNYSLKKHLASLPFCPDRKDKITTSFIGKSLKPSDWLLLSDEELMQKEESFKEKGFSKPGLLGTLAQKEVLDFHPCASFIKEGRFAVFLTPMEKRPLLHSSALLLHPPILLSQYEIHGYYQGLHHEGIPLFDSTAAEKIRKWPLMLLHALLHALSPHVLKQPHWVSLPWHECTHCKTDLHDRHSSEECLSALVKLYIHAQEEPCLYTPKWIEEVVKNGASLTDLFAEEVASELGQRGGFSAAGDRGLKMVFAANQDWFEKALKNSLDDQIRQIYLPLLS